MTDLETRQLIADYLGDSLNAAELEDRLEDATWDLEEGPAHELASTALRLLAEYANGDWTDAELREHLGSINRLYWLSNAPRTSFTSGAATFILHQSQSEASGKSPLAVYA